MATCVLREDFAWPTTQEGPIEVPILSDEEVEMQTATKQKKARLCKQCRQPGHTIRTCKKEKDITSK
jgi:hypothetical protein